MENNQVDFFEDGNSFKSRKIMGAPEVPGISKFLVKHGIVSDEKKSYIVLIFFVVIALLIAAGLFGYYSLGIGNPQQIKYSLPDTLRGQMLGDNRQQ